MSAAVCRPLTIDLAAVPLPRSGEHRQTVRPGQRPGLCRGLAVADRAGRTVLPLARSAAEPRRIPRLRPARPGPAPQYPHAPGDQAWWVPHCSSPSHWLDHRRVLLALPVQWPCVRRVQWPCVGRVPRCDVVLVVLFSCLSTFCAPGLAKLGSLFWLADTVPRGFEAASTAHGVLPLAGMDSQTKADMAALMADRDGTVGPRPPMLPMLCDRSYRLLLSATCRCCSGLQPLGVNSPPHPPPSFNLNLRMAAGRRRSPAATQASTGR